MDASQDAQSRKNERGDAFRERVMDFAVLGQAEPDAETGLLLPRENDRRLNILIISVGEFARVNDEGGYDAGNQALAETVRLSKQAALEHLIRDAREWFPDVPAETLRNQQAARYDLFRVGGSDFALSVNAGPEVVEAIKNELSRASLPIVKGREPVPLTAVGVSLHDAMELFNAIQRQLSEDEDNGETGIRIGAEETDRTLANIVEQALSFRGEAARLEQMATRVRAKAARGDVDARDFYEKYVKKFFEHTELGSFDGMTRASAERTQDIVRSLVAHAFAAKRARVRAEEAVMLGQIGQRAKGTSLFEFPVASGKAYTRLRLLFDRMTLPAYRQTGSTHQRQTDTLVNFSRQAIFGAEGVRMLKEWVREFESRPGSVTARRQEIDAEIKAFAEARIETAAAGADRQRHLVDAFAESFAREQMRRQVRGLEAR